MNKLLKLLIDDYTQRDTSAEYKLLLQRACDVEKSFTATLNNEQRKVYFELDILNGDLAVLDGNEFAEYLYDAIAHYPTKR